MQVAFTIHMLNVHTAASEHSVCRVRANRAFCTWIPPKTSTDSIAVVHGFRDVFTAVLTKLIVLA